MLQAFLPRGWFLSIPIGDNLKKRIYCRVWCSIFFLFERSWNIPHHFTEVAMASMEVGGRFHGSFRESRESIHRSVHALLRKLLPWKLLRKYWKLLRKFWSTFTDAAAAIPEEATSMKASDCSHGSSIHRSHGKAFDNLLTWESFHDLLPWKQRWKLPWK